MGVHGQSQTSACMLCFFFVGLLQTAGEAPAEGGAEDTVSVKTTGMKAAGVEGTPKTSKCRTM